MTDDEDLTREEWNALGEGQMIALLTKAWAKPLVSLTDAVHWLATTGVPREPDYDELVSAADVLAEALQSGKLTAFGVAAGGEVHTPIPPDSIMSATASGSGFLDDLSLFVLPCIQWAHDPGEDRDLIVGMSDPIWSRLSVKREEIRRMWPATVERAAEVANDSKPISVALAVQLLGEEARERGGVLDAKAAEVFLNRLGYMGRDNIREAVKKLAPGRKQGRPKKVRS